ncbi:hypothetical protein ACHAXH_006126 [Discostella pseudostelligera]|jgi:hypothetical protein
MMLLLPPALAPLLLLATSSHGYSSAARQSSWRQMTTSTSTSQLHAGLRDLVGPYDSDEYGAASGPYIPPSIRDERNSVLRNDRSFGSGGYASGGTGGFGGGSTSGGGGGGFGRRNSPGFIGFRGDRNYPAYDVVIDTPVRGGGGGRGSSISSTRRNARIFDNVDFDDLPGSSTRRINNQLYNENGLVRSPSSDPYDRGLNSDFINTNGSPQRRSSRGRDTEYFDDFDAPRRGGFRGRGANVPQIYRRDLIDDGILDGRSFNQLTAVEQYFEAWNRRNIPLALSCFDDDVYYDDTQFSEPFEGKDKLANHLLYVAECLPDSFYFVVDELSVGRSQRSGRRRDRPASPTFQLGRNRVALATRRAANAPSISIGALWHVENEFGPLPFARGCSFFKVDPNSNLIVEAYDFPEPAVIKTGSTGLKVFGLASKLTTEPKRLLPFFVWLAYVYIVFFSNGILPGKDIFHADAKTWKEIQDLSFNFLFIAPITHMPTAAKVNPVLEGIFNGLLAWSFLFAGFLSDERSGLGPYGKDSRYYERLMQNQEQVLENGIVLIPPVNLTKKNLIPMVPTIVGMQFLTSAFMLPYLFARTTERFSSTQSLDNRRYEQNLPRRIRPLYKEELDRPALVLGEWKGLGVLLASIGLFALYWGVAGRPEDFGPPIWVSDKRMVDFMKILDSDRVASSFLVDFWVYGIFQGWLVDDDWKRRGRSMEEEKFLRNVAKFIPFFGLASYLIFRPQYPSSKEAFDYEAFFNARGSRRGGFSRRLNEGGGGRFDDRDERRNRF